MTRFDVMPLFSSPLAVCEVEESLDAIFDELRRGERYPFELTSASEAMPHSNPNYSTGGMSLLDDFPAEREAICRYFEQLKNEVYGLSTTDFVMTTSWGTRTERGGVGHFHAHRNSVFSGVVYGETIDGGAPIEFERPHLSAPTFLLNDPAEWNIYNCDTWHVQPRKNVMMIFPSHLRHRIGVHNSDVPRHSVAFNFFPTGRIGRGDSSINIWVR